MAKMNPSQIDRSRPSSRLQPQSMLATTPVLFRLPCVQLQPLPPVADFPTESLLDFQAELPEVGKPDPEPIQSNTKTDAKTEDSPKASWWEHWSSGIVLIILLIAAYVACVAVLRSRGKASSTLAKESKDSTDAGNLMIPPVITELSINRAPSEAERELMNSLFGETTTKLDLLPETNSLTSTATTNTLSPTSATQTPTTATLSPMATAELLQPTQMPQLPLFDSFQPAATGVNAIPVSSQLGQSPTMYDGASIAPNVGLLPTNSPGSSSLAEPSLPEFNAMTLASGPNGNGYSPNSFTLGGPSLAAPNVAIGGNGINHNSPAIPNLVPTLQTQTPVASTVSTPTSSNTSSTSGSSAVTNSASPTMRATATPEASGEVESIIRAYVELSRAGQLQSTNGTGSNNRYQPTR